MKKILIAIFFVIAFCATTEAQTTDNLEQVVISYNEKCPVVIADGTTLKKVQNTEEGVVFCYSVDGDLFANLVNLASILHDSLLAEMESSPDKDMQTMLNYCKNKKTKLIQRFTNEKGGTFDIVILPSEL